MEIIKVFKISDTLNNKLNVEKLSIELKTSTITVEANPVKFGDEIYVRFPEELPGSDITTLNALIAAHDGGDAEAYNEASVAAREKKIRELNQMAMYHPVLDNIMTVRFLTHIDNYVNAYIRSGIATVVQEKIMQEAENTEGDFYTYLHQIVNTKGNKTYEYFLASIN